jgi:pilus assembly protein CpaF
VTPARGRPAAIEDEVHRRVVADAEEDVGASATRHALALDPLLADHDLAAVVGRVVARARGLGPLEALVADPTVDEVLVNAGREVWIERAGRLERVPLLLDPATVLHVIERILAPLGRRVDRSSPVVDARLADGARVHAIVPPLAIDGPCLSIRRFGATPVPLTAFGPPDVVALLRSCVLTGANVLVSGATSSGKTTLLNALGGAVPSSERIITIEDAAELRLPGEHVVRLESRPATVEGVGAVTLRDLVRAALRMRPDRLVVGEVRGPEALDMVMAMSTGHDGSLATCHANSAVDALRRVEVMVLQGGELPLSAIRDVVHAAVDVVVHVERGRRGRRQLAEVFEVAEPGSEGPGRGRTLATGQGVVARPERPPRRLAVLGVAT